jgi:hypothetical protein
MTSKQQKQATGILKKILSQNPSSASTRPTTTMPHFKTEWSHEVEYACPFWGAKNNFSGRVFT